MEPQPQPQPQQAEREGGAHKARLPDKPANRLARCALFALLVATVVAGVWCHAQGDALLAWCKAVALACSGFVARHEAAAWVIYLVLGAALINCPVPVAAILKVMAGFMFGVASGWALNILVSALGCALGFVLTRRLFYRAFYARFSHSLARANLEIARNGFWYVLSCRFFVVTPFFLTNILAGLSSMRLGVFVAATAVGVTPSSLVYALAGGELEHVRTTADLMSPRAALVLLLFGLASLAPALARRRRRLRA